MIAKGGSKPEIITIRSLQNTILFSAAYPLLDEKFGYAEANKLNREMVVSRCVLLDEWAIMIEATFSMLYDKKAFGGFFEEFRSEVRGFLELTDKLKNNEE